MKYANITPIKAIFNKPEANRLSVEIQNDNLTASAQFSYKLLLEKIFVMNGIVNCTEEDYLSWNGNNDFPFNFVAEQLGLTIIDIVEDVPEEPVEVVE